jgi:hypothetical protein
MILFIEAPPGRVSPETSYRQAFNGWRGGSAPEHQLDDTG